MAENLGIVDNLGEIVETELAAGTLAAYLETLALPIHIDCGNQLLFCSFKEMSQNLFKNLKQFKKISQIINVSIQLAIE